MSTNNKLQQGDKTYFEQQRELVLQDVATVRVLSPSSARDPTNSDANTQNLEQVLQNMNTLNRSLESVIAVGNEFGQVEGLWSMFENVMAQQQQPQHNDEEGNTQAHTGAQERGQ
ncbi:hypothetical protein E4T48_03874 [Aureobasidium sp. EXF-10727]|nr:hypothetical protein E4T48_03874 [Aureobasidium sp. EXF-10727]